MPIMTGTHGISVLQLMPRMPGMHGVTQLPVIPGWSA